MALNIPPTDWAGCLPPSGRAGCSLRDPFANKKSFFIREGALGGVWKKLFEHPARWLGGMSPAPRLPPDDRAGGAHFSNFSQLPPLFRILIFFKPFFKKNSKTLWATAQVRMYSAWACRQHD
jgi:hypothetical protein